MTPNINLNSMPSRIIYMAMVSVIGLTLLASYLYLFKKPYQEYTQLKENRDLLQKTVDSGTQLSQNILIVKEKVDGIKKELQGDGPVMPLNKMIAHTIDRLDTISSHHTIQLLSVKPTSPKKVFMFKEIPFSIEVSGQYYSIYQWLQEVEEGLGPMVVKKFEIIPQSSESNLLMKLNMVSYTSSQEGI